MKLLFLVLLCGGYSMQVKAQEDEVLKKKLWDEYKNKKLFLDSSKTFKPRANITIPPLVPKPEVLPQIDNKMMVLKVPLKRTYSGNNGLGSDIYTMQPDNMPCLVPDKTFTSNMPVAEFGAPGELNLQFDSSPKKPGNGVQKKDQK